MFSPSLACETLAHEPAIPQPVEYVYRELAEFLANGSIEEESLNGRFFSWREMTALTVGGSDWHGEIPPLTLSSRNALGITRPSAGLSLVVTISPFPIVARAIADSLTRLISLRTQVPTVRSEARVRLGAFVQERFDSLRDRISFLEFLDGSGVTYTVRRRDKAFTSRPTETNLNARGEAQHVKDTDWASVPGLTAVGLIIGGSQVIVSRMLSLQVPDVATPLSRIAETVEEAVKTVSPFVELIEKKGSYNDPNNGAITA